MSKKTLTVFTPAYNRAYSLPLGYESLCRQTCDDFQWLIVDDGSTLGHHRVRGSVWVVVVVAAVFPKTCAVALVFQRRLLEKNGSFPGSPQKDFEKSRGRDVIDLSSTLTCG